MNKCEEFWDGAAKTPGLPVPISGTNGHLAECPACAARLAHFQRLELGLKALAADRQPAAAPARVESALIAAFRAHRARRGATLWRRPAMLWSGAALAAALAVAFWIAPGALPRRGSHAPAPAAHRGPSGRVELAALTPETYSDGFIPLPNAPQIDPNDDVNVVRMEMPRSTMLSLGLEVSPDDVSQTVEAEVMLGPDGLARAVRFLD